MTVKIIKMEQPNRDKAVFFNVLFEISDGVAFIIPGWKAYDNRIFTPSKAGKDGFWNTIYLSEEAARLVYQAIQEAHIEGLDLDHDAYVSSKWGKSSLSSLAHTPEAGIEIWRKHRYVPKT